MTPRSPGLLTPPNLQMRQISSQPCPALPCVSHVQGYVVLDRPYAFKQWVDQYLDKIEGGWVGGWVLQG